MGYIFCTSELDVEKLSIRVEGYAPVSSADSFEMSSLLFYIGLRGLFTIAVSLVLVQSKLFFV
jgi:hypothetical protein